MSRRISPVIPGFGLTLGYTLVYLSLLVLIPLGAMFLKTTQLSWEQFWAIISAPRVLAALKLSFGTALAAGPSADVTALKARVDKLAEDFPLYPDLDQIH